MQKNIQSLNREILLDRMETSYKKLDHKIFTEDKFELQPYLTNLQTNQARQQFRLRSFMPKTVKMNFPSDVEFKKQL